MTCRHSKGDPNCSSNRSYDLPEPKTPDKKNFVIKEALEVGSNLILKVEYPNCKKCSYEGEKVMVFKNRSAIDALKWKEIDPHFRLEGLTMMETIVAPSPIARFPASAQGWQDAEDYASVR